MLTWHDNDPASNEKRWILVALTSIDALLEHRTLSNGKFISDSSVPCRVECPVGMVGATR